MTMFRRISAGIAACLLLSHGSIATSQTATAVAATARVAAAVSSSAKTRLQGHIPSWATSANDVGVINASQPLTNLHLVLARSASVEAAFEQLLADQQNPSSARYHQWLTPQQNAAQYGIAASDLSAVTDWMKSQGLTVDNVAAGGLFITFSGPASAVESAFSTSLHNFSHENGVHFAPTTEPAVPSALSGVIAAIGGLSEQMAHLQSTARPVPDGETVSLNSGAARPLYTSSSGSAHYLAPGDFNTIYDINPVYSAGYTGTGYHVANIIDSRIATADITGFNSVFGLSVAQPNQILVPNNTDPGIKTDSEGEAALDVQRILGTAPGTTVDLLVINSLSFTNLYSALQYEVGTLNDPVVNMSLGACNSGSTSQSTTFDSYFKAGAAQGISFFISSGDNAAAGCDSGLTTIPNNQVLATNLICASSYATCVGGTEFAEGSGAYWNSSNNSARTSATGYIPEGAWNEPTYTTSGKTTYQASGTGGGVTKFPKPTWQTGVGVPSDGVRDVPDISFSASLHDGYLVCQVDSGNDCSSGTFKYIIYGTSASSPAMAGIATLLDQRLGARQGNLNPVFYSLAANTSNGVFHDATPATSGVSSCATATPSMCNNSTPSATSLTGGLAGYPLTTGYDLATGWGSLDVSNFITAAAGTTATTGGADTTLSLTASANPITTTQTVTFTATVATSTAATPTGTVQFYSNGSALGSAITVSGGKATSATQTFSTAGTYSITAIYSGDTTFAAATSGAVSLVVTAARSFTITPASSAITVTSGATTGNTNNITLTSNNSFAGTVALSCTLSASTAVNQPTCSISPSSVTLAANGSATATVTLSTTTTKTASLERQGLTAGEVAFACLLCLIPFRRKSLIRPLLAVLFLIGGMSAVSGCGKGGGVTTTPTTTTTAGSAGTYTVTVTGTSGSTTAGSTFTFLVQ